MESKKRRCSEEDFLMKKRASLSLGDSQELNGVYERGPDDKDNLELFRKEALFRRMRYYSRENDRSQARISELEHRKKTCETGLAAVSACLNQLVSLIRFLVIPEDETRSDDDIITLVLSNDEGMDFKRALESTINNTKTFLYKLTKVGGYDYGVPASRRVFEEYEKATTECNFLRSELKILRVNLQDSEEQKDRYHTALLAAERRIDRAKSRTLAMQAGNETLEVNDCSLKESLQKTISPETPRSPQEDFDTAELEILRQHISSRDVKIVVLEKEAALLRDEKTILESELNALSDEIITETPQYRALLSHTSFLQASLNDNRTQVARLEEEAVALRASRNEWEEGVIAATGQANQELKTMLAKRDADNARLRDQREQYAAELNERKHKDNIKYSSIQELKALVDSRSERIFVLESEVGRYKAQLEANANKEDLMLFLMNGNTREVDLVDFLKDRITALENQNAVLEQSLANSENVLSIEPEQLNGESAALKRLVGVEAELAKYKPVLGDSSNISPDVSELSRQLHQKEEELERFRLLDVQHSQAEKSLYVELDKLSVAWESLDRQVRSKVFDLVAMEDRLTKSSLDKAKSENKFYSAMRDKDAIESERKNLVRNMEKQVKLVERLGESEKNLTSQLNAAEKEISHLKAVGTSHRDKVDDLTKELCTWMAKAEGEKKRVVEIRSRYVEREKSIETKKMELQRLEDNLIRTKKGLEQKMKDFSTTNHNSSPSEQELLQLLKCSCRKRFRNTLITKCMHTFCKDCVDIRIATRQRKCPACGTSFSQSDVLTGMFFQ